MHTRALKIVVLSPDRTILRHVNKFLTAFGYEALSAVDLEQAVAALQTGITDVLIVDDRIEAGVVEACRCLLNSKDRPGITLLMTQQIDDPSQDASRVFTAALAAGVDDFLARPIVYGEWLARLRSSARALENRRRQVEQVGLDRTTSLPGKSSFRRELDRRLQKSMPADPQLACAVVDLDLFRRVVSRHGNEVASQLVLQVAQRLGESLQPVAEQATRRAPAEGSRNDKTRSHDSVVEILACFNGDRFAVLLDGCDRDQAIAAAERICASLAEKPFAVAGLDVKVTASGGVACSQGGLFDADDLICRAEYALELAKGSGRNCVVCDDQFLHETSVWHELAGRLFETTKARDVMTPCPVLLHVDDLLHRATALFERTELIAIPVVDDSEQLVGVVWRESFINGSDIHETYPASHLSGKLSGQLDDSVPWLEENSDFSELVKQLSDDATPLLVVTDARRPTGLLTAPGLASLSQPLSVASFHHDKLYDDTPRYLAVAEQSQLPASS